MTVDSNVAAFPELPVTYVYRDVHFERVRAHKKHGAKGNSREDAKWNDGEWLAIVMEEVGEVAHELTYDAPTGSEWEHRDRLRKELVQVAAMVSAWVDAIDKFNKSV